MRLVVAVILLVVALLIGGLELIALIDPVGTKMADDSDPFGPPSAWSDHAALLGISGLAALGAGIPARRRGDGDKEEEEES